MEFRRSIWVVYRERVRDRFGLKAHGRLCTCVDTGFDHPTHYPVQVGCPDCGKYDTENGDIIGDIEEVGATGPTGQGYHKDNHSNVNSNPDKATSVDPL